MRVDRIYTRGVVALPRSAGVEQAAALMDASHVGAIVVTEETPDGPRAAGMLTDRDIVIQTLARGYDPRVFTVGELMTPTVGTVEEHASVHEAIEIMRAAGVRRLVVTRKGAVAGMLSMDDVIDGLAADLARVAAGLKAGIAREAKLHDRAIA